MRKYVLTDKAGSTAERLRVTAGKFVHAAAPDGDEPLTRMTAEGHDSPLLAALEAPGPTDPHARLFMLNTHAVTKDPKKPQAYTVVKEIPAPAVTLEHKLIFGISAICMIYKNAEFRQWTKNWLSGQDRSVATARAIKEALKKEALAAGALEALAAWSETAGRDEETVHEHGDTEKRALHIAAAAELAARPEADADEVAGAIALATRGIDRYQDKVDLVDLAEKVVGHRSSPLRKPS